MFANLTGNLSSLVNIAPTANKLVLIPTFKTFPTPQFSGPPYVIQFNPKEYSQNERIGFHQENAIGKDGTELKFARTSPKDYQFELLIDGTGASGVENKREVLAEIELFKATVAFKGNLHRPNTLLLIWGALIIFCELTQLNIKYTLFRPNGTPLRALLSVTFKETVNVVQSLLQMALESTDLTHRRVVQEGDKLPLMCQNVYQTTRYYLEVARANEITNFRSLKPGMELIFPPVAK